MHLVLPTLALGFASSSKSCKSKYQTSFAVVFSDFCVLHKIFFSELDPEGLEPIRPLSFPA
jgi:hypothetical protein